MSEAREWMIQWARDAHAMEEQAVTMLTSQASRLQHYPHIQDGIERHLEETRNQAQRLKVYLNAVGEGNSAMKDIGGKLTAIGQAFSGIFAGDEVMKGALAGYTFEQMEIASYSIQQTCTKYWQSRSCSEQPKLSRSKAPDRKMCAVVGLLRCSFAVLKHVSILKPVPTFERHALQIRVIAHAACAAKL